MSSDLLDPNRRRSCDVASQAGCLRKTTQSLRGAMMLKDYRIEIDVRVDNEDDAAIIGLATVLVADQRKPD
jgi:hypothetical protein